MTVAVAVLSIVIVLDARDDDDCDEKTVKEKDSTKPPEMTTTESPDTEPVFRPSGYGEFRFAAVADDAGVCSTIGTEILARKGGSVVDSAIATLLCVGVVNMHSCGVGGGHIMTIYAAPRNDTEKQLMTVLARERAPAAATEDMFVPENASSSIGGLAAGIPSEVKGYYEEWLRYGQLAWSELFQPAIHLCRNGYAVNSALASAISMGETVIRADDQLSELLVKEDGRLLTEGDTIYNPKLAATLEKIAENPLAFYDPSSDLAQDIIADIQERGGIITGSDLSSYVPYIKPPVNFTLQNGAYTMFAPAPPSSGVVLGHILNILDGYFFTPSSVDTTDDKILAYHRITEAFKFAYGKRSALGDEEFVDVEELVANMTSKEFSESIRHEIDDSRTHNISYYRPAFESTSDTGTAHLSILAADGSAVSVTSTINYRFGSKVRGSRTGIIFNNQMDDFSTPGTYNAYGFPASPSNYIVPGKMPMSSMSPSIFFDSNGEVAFISGASGGSRIISSTAFVTINALWFGKQIDVATGIHRIHHQLVPPYICAEEGFDEQVAAGLTMKGHEVRVCGFANCQSIHNTCGDEDTLRPRHCIKAASDGRKSGIPDGY